MYGVISDTLITELNFGQSGPKRDGTWFDVRATFASPARILDLDFRPPNSRVLLVAQPNVWEGTLCRSQTDFHGMRFPSSEFYWFV